MNLFKKFLLVLCLAVSVQPAYGWSWSGVASSVTNFITSSIPSFFSQVTNYASEHKTAVVLGVVGLLALTASKYAYGKIDKIKAQEEEQRLEEEAKRKRQEAARLETEKAREEEQRLAEAARLKQIVEQKVQEEIEKKRLEKLREEERLEFEKIVGKRKAQEEKQRLEQRIAEEAQLKRIAEAARLNKIDEEAQFKKRIEEAEEEVDRERKIREERQRQIQEEEQRLEAERETRKEAKRLRREEAKRLRLEDFERLKLEEERTTQEEIERLEEERQTRKEAKWLRREEAKRLRLEDFERLKLEEERITQEERLTQETERKARKARKIQEFQEEQLRQYEIFLQKDKIEQAELEKRLAAEQAAQKVQREEERQKRLAEEEKIREEKRRLEEKQEEERHREAELKAAKIAQEAEEEQKRLDQKKQEAEQKPFNLNDNILFSSFRSPTIENDLITSDKFHDECLPVDKLPELIKETSNYRDLIRSGAKLVWDLLYTDNIKSNSKYNDTFFYNLENPEDHEYRNSYLADIVRVCWFMYSRALDKNYNKVFKEASLVVYDTEDRIFNFLLNYVKKVNPEWNKKVVNATDNPYGYCRNSTHIIESQEKGYKHFGIDIRFSQNSTSKGWRSPILPAGKTHILFGKVDENRIFIKMKNDYFYLIDRLNLPVEVKYIVNVLTYRTEEHMPKKIKDEAQHLGLKISAINDICQAYQKDNKYDALMRRVIKQYPLDLDYKDRIGNEIILDASDLQCSYYYQEKATEEHKKAIRDFVKIKNLIQSLVVKLADREYVRESALEIKNLAKSLEKLPEETPALPHFIKTNAIFQDILKI